MIYLSLAIPSACKNNTEAYPDCWWLTAIVMGMVDDENDDEEKEGEEKGTREWRRATIEFSLIVLKCF